VDPLKAFQLKWQPWFRTVDEDKPEAIVKYIPDPPPLTDTLPQFRAPLEVITLPLIAPLLLKESTFVACSVLDPDTVKALADTVCNDEDPRHVKPLVVKLESVPRL